MPDSVQIANFLDLKAHVDLYGGVWSVSLGFLRQLAGYGRLGENVLQAIHHELHSVGLRYYPIEVELDQRQLIRLYSTDAIARVIDAVLYPSYASDSILRALATRSIDSRVEHALASLKEIQRIVSETAAYLED